MTATPDMLRSICVFCGSSSGGDPIYQRAAGTLGHALAASGRRLIYGGGNVGLMGVLADSVLDCGGEVVGVIPRQLVDLELAHRNASELHIVDSMHQRKLVMSDLADAFIILPGGLGSLDEFFEIWTWGQLGIHRKPYGLLNVASYFDSLLDFLDHAVRERFVQPEHRNLLLVDDEPHRLLNRIDAHTIPALQKAVDRTAS